MSFKSSHVDRMLPVLLILIVLLLTGCGQQDTADELGTEVTLLYPIETDEKAAGEILPAAGTEVRTVYTDSAGPELLLRLWLSGPETQGLRAAVSSEDTLILTGTEDGTADVEWNRIDHADPVDDALSEACLVLTLCGADSVDRVTIHLTNRSGETSTFTRSASDYALSDTGSGIGEINIKLYFADADDRYLLVELRKIAPTDTTLTARAVIEALLAGPEEEEHYPTIPEGTELLGLTVSDGIAAVNLSSAFCENRPDTEAGEWMTVYSLVNSLTQLEDIRCVRLLCEGEVIDYYRYMRLDKLLTGCETLVGPVQYGLNEYDADACLISWSRDYLAAMPIRVPQLTAASREAELINMLLELQPPEGFQNPFPDGTELLSVEVTDGVCTVDLSAEFASDEDDSQLQRLRVNALTASLCSLSDIRAVRILVEGAVPSMGWYDLREPLSPQPDWFFPD